MRAPFAGARFYRPAAAVPKAVAKTIRICVMMTAEEYIQSLRDLRPRRVYAFGEKIEDCVGHPLIHPSINCCAMTYKLAEMPEYRELMVTASNFTGKAVNRFCHLHQSTADLVNKVKMQRLCGSMTGACFQRCVGMDALNAVFSTTYEIDARYGTEYHRRFVEFIKEWQEKDWTVDGAMTDPKGNRGLAPYAQKDPDMFLRVVERREDGIVVRGAKMHQTGALNSHQILVMPTQTMRAEDRDYAVAFSVPADDPSVLYIYGRQASDTRKLEASKVDVGNANYGGQEVIIIFEDTFIPYKNVYMLGEIDFTGMLVERFAGYHRQSYGGCKVGNGDVLIGASQTAAECNGCAKASHIKDKIIEMIHLNETLFSCGIACSCEGAPTRAGNYQIDMLLAQRVQAERHPAALRDRPPRAGHRRRAHGDHAFRCRFHVRRSGRMVPQAHGGRCPVFRGRPPAHPPPHRGHDHRFRGGGLPHRIHARRRFAAGPAHHDRPSGQHGSEEGPCTPPVRHRPRRPVLI